MNTTVLECKISQNRCLTSESVKCRNVIFYYVFKCNLVNNKEHQQYPRSEVSFFSASTTVQCFTHVAQFWQCVEFLSASVAKSSHHIALPPPSLFFPLFFSVTGACFCLLFVGAHGWVAALGQPWGVIQSWGWLPKVEALGHSRHPTSTKRCSC